MTVLEKKLDALMRYCAADYGSEKMSIRDEIRKMINESVKDDVTVLHDAKIRQILFELCASEHKLGYEFIVEAVLIGVEDPKKLMNLTWGAYAEIAIKHEISIDNVQRGIHRVVDEISNEAPPEALYKYFGKTIDGKRNLSNSMFLTRIANVVRCGHIEGVTR